MVMSYRLYCITYIINEPRKILIFLRYNFQQIAFYCQDKISREETDITLLKKDAKNVEDEKRAINDLQDQTSKQEDINRLMASSLAQFCDRVYKAIKQTTATMNDVKRLMWYNWENETICESFYDAIQFSQHLLENLSTTWTIAFSLFRAQELELLYKAERLATMSASSHQISLKFIMSCWQTYMAACCYCWAGELSQIRVKVKESIHTIGQLFAASLESAHSLMVAISQGLAKIPTTEWTDSNEP